MIIKRHSGLASALIILNVIAAGIRAQRLPQPSSQQLNETQSNRPPIDAVTSIATTPSQIGGDESSAQPATEQPINVETKASLPEKSGTYRSLVTAGIKPTALPSLQPLALAEVAKLSPLDKAYLDVYSILRDSNECSEFFGGPAAIEVLNQLTRQLRPAYFDRSIGLRMTGRISYAMNDATRLSYRIFETAQLNTNGPFFKTSAFPTDSVIARVGEFSPNTSEARLTILLHELGHMIQRPNGDWVLPNDGDNPATSKENTQKVIDVCRNQIKKRGQVSFEKELAVMQTDRQEAEAQLTALKAGSAPSTPDLKRVSPELLRHIGSQDEARCDSCRPEIQNPQDR